MAFDAHKNLATTTVAVGGAPTPATTGTSLTVATGTGACFPTAPFNATAAPLSTLPDPTNAEIVRVTAVTGDVLTIVRAQEGTTAQSIGSSWQITASITVKTLTDIEGPAAGALQAANNLSDVPNAGNARANLGLGSAATQASTAFDAAGAAAAVQAASLQKASNLSDLANVATARTNLGLGGAAILNVGKATGTVAAGDDERFNAPYRFFPEDYGAKGDGKVLTDVAITSGSAVATSASGGWAGAVVGQPVLVEGAGTVNSGTLVATVASVQSTTQVTLSTTAAATVTGAWAVWGTDDTSAINQAVTAASTYGQANGWYAEVKFSNRIYMVAGAPTQGGTTKGNAQIPLPVLPMSGPKLTLRFVGLADGPSTLYGANTSPQTYGAMLVCARSDGTLNASFGPATMIGGPTKQGTAATAVATNLRPVFDGLTILLPLNSTYSGIDTYGCAGLVVGTLSVLAFGTQAHLGLTSTVLTNHWGFGLRTPTLANDGAIIIRQFNASGLYVGLQIGEHVAADNILIFFCYFGLRGYTDDSGSPMTHASRILYACVEACAYNYSGAEALIRLDIGTLDMDGGLGGGVMIYDPSNTLWGEVTYRGHLDVLTITGGSLLRVISGDETRGAKTAPGIPATTVALANPFYRDCAVTITGGTVTAVAVDGTATGLTTGTVIVPTGKTITLTYTVAPTWVWVAL